MTTLSNKLEELALRTENLSIDLNSGSLGDISGELRIAAQSARIPDENKYAAETAQEMHDLSNRINIENPLSNPGRDSGVAWRGFRYIEWQAEQIAVLAAENALMREALEYINSQFEGERFMCSSCGHEEPTKDCDSHIYLKDFLASTPNTKAMRMVEAIDAAQTLLGHRRIVANQSIQTYLPDNDAVRSATEQLASAVRALTDGKQG